MNGIFCIGDRVGYSTEIYTSQPKVKEVYGVVIYVSKEHRVYVRWDAGAEYSYLPHHLRYIPVPLDLFEGELSFEV